MPEKRAKASKKPKLTPKNRFHIEESVKSKLLLLVALALIFMGLTFLNTYVSKKFPKVDHSFNLDAKGQPLANQKGPIRIDPALMKESNAIESPTRVVIPSVSIDINITESAVKDGFWETSETTASHGMGSPNPGQTGNAVLFAHARPGLFYNLKDLKKDDIVYVFTAKKWYAYKVEKIDSVFPDQVEVIAPTKNEQITLYTCTGYADEKRLIVVAKPIKSS